MRCQNVTTEDTEKKYVHPERLYSEIELFIYKYPLCSLWFHFFRFSSYTQTLKQCLHTGKQEYNYNDVPHRSRLCFCQYLDPYQGAEHNADN